MKFSLENKKNLENVFKRYFSRRQEAKCQEGRLLEINKRKARLYEGRIKRPSRIPITDSSLPFSTPLQPSLNNSPFIGINQIDLPSVSNDAIMTPQIESVTTKENKMQDVIEMVLTGNNNKIQSKEEFMDAIKNVDPSTFIEVFKNMGEKLFEKKKTQDESTVSQLATPITTPMDKAFLDFKMNLDNNASSNPVLPSPEIISPIQSNLNVIDLHDGSPKNDIISSTPVLNDAFQDPLIVYKNELDPFKTPAPIDTAQSPMDLLMPSPMTQSPANLLEPSPMMQSPLVSSLLSDTPSQQPMQSPLVSSLLAGTPSQQSMQSPLVSSLLAGTPSQQPMQSPLVSSLLAGTPSQQSMQSPLVSSLLAGTPSQQPMQSPLVSSLLAGTPSQQPMQSPLVSSLLAGTPSQQPMQSPLISSLLADMPSQQMMQSPLISTLLSNDTSSQQTLQSPLDNALLNNIPIQPTSNEIEDILNSISQSTIPNYPLEAGIQNSLDSAMISSPAGQTSSTTPFSFSSFNLSDNSTSTIQNDTFIPPTSLLSGNTLLGANLETESRNNENKDSDLEKVDFIMKAMNDILQNNGITQPSTSSSPSSTSNGIEVDPSFPSNDCIKRCMVKEEDFDFTNENITKLVRLTPVEVVQEDVIELEKLASQKRGKGRPRKPRKFSICPFANCHKKFNREFNLKEHIRIHNPKRNKDFVCEYCNEGFFSSSVLSRHIASIHQGEKFFCKNCGKKFNRKDALHRHEKISCHLTN
ncbi:hypothetical protein BCR36DRAFT_325829 [Piromyces finnis]|uniref:C2H2-type domain-containing protein n=1 Tax=Piromyces finnis TaxID=1754191 RepID=A0A1Y1VC51_9FUNG|nr:hypothetical protein BCR36DRAFT_325829 [Piromyces finnis]|eukprot:ORX51480.1 hypothetical protein BCR36DRAFT_325829 [Piromyces finnis]